MAKDYKIYTYATHSQGNFERLLRDCDITVLGFGRKWNGFMDKFKGMRDALQREPNKNLLVIFLDGFDTKVCQNPDVAVEKYRSLYPSLPLLCSSHRVFGRALDSYFHTKVFDGGANSGMYMGPLDKVQQTLEAAIKLEDACLGDDQRAMNKALRAGCVDYAIDVDRQIFCNLTMLERFRTDQCLAPFVSTPGEFSYRRLKRACSEYLPFLKLEVSLFLAFMLVVALLIMACAASAKHRRRQHYR